MKILVTGKNGQVGSELLRSLTSLGIVVGIDIDECDLQNVSAIEKLLDKVQPDLIVNPAAYTAVDKAETEQALAYSINAKAPEVMARYAATQNIPMIHYSTDYVFNGLKEGAYLENQPWVNNVVSGEYRLWLNKQYS